MDTPLATELASFHPHWRRFGPVSRDAWKTAPDWLTIRIDEESEPGAGPWSRLLDLLAPTEAVLADLRSEPRPLEVWIDSQLELMYCGANAMTGMFSDGAARMVLGSGASDLVVSHELGHYVALTTRIRDERSGPLERLAQLVLEEYFAHRVGLVLLRARGH